MSITKENLIMITTTISGNQIAEKRRKMLIDTMSVFDIPVFFDHGIKEGYYIDIQYRVMKRRMEQYIKLSRGGFEYAILCDDDFHCHPNLLEELNKTVELLPPDWRCLHLCPGCLWGKTFFKEELKKETFNIGELFPVWGHWVLQNLDTDSTGRFFMNCGNGLWNQKYMWLGGPIAILVRKDTIASLLEEYTCLYERENNPNDVLLTNILSNRDFVCRIPQLGYEDENGGSCF